MSRPPDGVRWQFGPVSVDTVFLPGENRWQSTARIDAVLAGLDPQIRYGDTHMQAERKAVAAVLEAVARSLRRIASNNP